MRRPTQKPDLSRYDPKDVTFENLRVHYQTGRSYVISGTGRDRVYGYRNGMQTNLVDIEQETCIALARDLIELSGEQELFSWILAWEREHIFHCHTKAELELEALEAHMSRLFDNEAWCDFIPFNQQYRPEVLEKATLRWIQTDCCQERKLVTQARIDWIQKTGGTIFCSQCNTASTFSVCPE